MSNIYLLPNIFNFLIRNYVLFSGIYDLFSGIDVLFSGIYVLFSGIYMMSTNS